MLPVHIQVSDSIPWCDLEDHSSEPTCLRQSAARRSGPGCRSRHRRASAGSSWTRLSTALCLSQVRQCAVSFRSHRMTNKIVLRRPIESAQSVSFLVVPWLHRKRVLRQHHMVGELTAALGASKRGGTSTAYGQLPRTNGPHWLV